MGMEPSDIRLTRIEDGLVALRGELRTYHKEILHPVVGKVDGHDRIITGLQRDRFWVSSLAGILASWVGLKLFGKG